jgi:peptidoglycan/xylan/chitin deacetylase (PgdA/CDA1 family)
VSVPALMYHDVTPRGHEDASGFAGGDAARYKLTPERFARHLAAIRAHAAVPPILTFDDGGVSAEQIAEALEHHGWHGWFFVTTNRVNRPGFLDAGAIRKLRARGHVIGSHSHTHPLRMGRCSDVRLADEWARSVTMLSDLLGEPVTTASVPGGEYTDRVAQAASRAGIELLFTSEPTLAVREVSRLQVRGRFPIFASTHPATAAALAGGAAGARALWSARWTTRRIAKRALGDAYGRVRGSLLGASSASQWGDDLANVSEDSA